MGHPRQPRSPAVKALTPLELHILNRLAHGHRYKEIATELGISLTALTAHNTRLRRKLSARNTCHAVTIAHRTGLITD
jgi:DNA-binding CsgD family transcriptional regulator